MQCLADVNTAAISTHSPPADQPLPTSESSAPHGTSVARTLAAWLTQSDTESASVPSAVAEALLDALDPDWRTAPWAQTDRVEAFSDYAAARRAELRGGAGFLVRAWEGWVARPIFGPGALTWYSSADAAVAQAPRVTGSLLLDIVRAVDEAAPGILLCSPPTLHCSRLLEATVRLEVRALYCQCTEGT